MSEVTATLEVTSELKFRTTKELEKFAAALTKAQAEIKPPKRDKTAKMGTYEYKYADLASIIDAIRKPLTDAGIAIIQAPTSDDGLVVVTTRLLHTSGQWIECSMSAAPAGQTPQALGSVITYLRRYTLSAMTGVATEDDDDGAAAEKKRKRETRPAAPKQSHEVEAAAAKLRAELLKRTKTNSAAVSLLSAITANGEKPGIRNVAEFKTIDETDKAWVRLDEVTEAPMMPRAKDAETAAPRSPDHTDNQTPSAESAESQDDRNLFT